MNAFAECVSASKTLVEPEKPSGLHKRELCSRKLFREHHGDECIGVCGT